MLCSSKSQLSPGKRVQHWENQNQFLQARHGHKKDITPETILVRLRCDEDGFELLSWAISVAARPGDSVIAFHINHEGFKAENSLNKLHEHETAAPIQLDALRELCKIKQVHLDAKFVTCGNEEHELIEEASSRLATMVVLSPSNRHELRNIQKMGSLLVQRVHSGCSVVIVKDYKVIFNKQNVVKEAKESSSLFSEVVSESSCGTPPILRSKSLNQSSISLQRQFSCKSIPLWPHEKEGSHDHDTNISTGKKVWSVYSGEVSPRGVLDGIRHSSESEISSPSCSSSSLPHSLSRKISLQADNEVTSQYRSQSVLKLRRNGSIKRLSTFPPTTSCLKTLPGPMDCTSMKSSFKMYINTLRSTESMSHDPFMPTPDVQPNWRCFSYEELAIATDNFNPDNMVGRGGHSEVYRGVLQEGRLVAIKRLKKGRSEEINEKDFLTELGIIGHVSHPNTIPLVGFCVEKGLHLIFNFSSNGSLATLLHGVNAPLLDWSTRYRVAVGTARGLHYLHTACPRRIIHRDIKASNILLGPEFEPQISDFGLAKWLPEQWTQLSVFPVEGTFGYLAPEYFMHGIIHEKTDVFAYGVLLLELITGRQPINKSPQQSLVIWAKPLLESLQIEDLADPRLAQEYDLEEMHTMVKAAGLCVHSSAVCRPFMGQVLEMLTGENCESHGKPFTASEHYQDPSEEYSSTSYLSDLSRHREIALEF